MLTVVCPSGGGPLSSLPSPPGAPGRGSNGGRANILVSISTMTIPESIARENGAFFLDAVGLSDFKQSQVTHPGGNTTIINGTMTVTTEQGPTPNVPSYLLFQNDRMSVWVNPIPLHNHFGPTSLITGIIVNPQLLAQVRSMEAPNVQPGGGAAGSTR